MQGHHHLSLETLEAVPRSRAAMPYFQHECERLDGVADCCLLALAVESPLVPRASAGSPGVLAGFFAQGGCKEQGGGRAKRAGGHATQCVCCFFFFFFF